MNRRLLFILIIVAIAAFYLHGMNVAKNSTREFQVSDSILTSRINYLLEDYNIPEPAFNLALNGFYNLKSKGLVKNDSLLVIIDFSKSANLKRLFIIDLKNEKLIKNTYVAHGMQSGIEIAEDFSNRRLSYKSSLGLYLTAETYEGKHGYSLRLDGMSKDLNDNARKRAVVIHGASYVSEDFIKNNGRLGRSYGCPAVPVDESKEIIDLIKEGTCLYIYHPSLIPISQSALEKLP